MTYRPLPCEVRLGKFAIPAGVNGCRYPLVTACTHRPGALAIRMSAVRAPVACSAAYLEKMTGSSRSVAVTWIHGYFTLNALTPRFIWVCRALLYMSRLFSCLEPAISWAWLSGAAAAGEPDPA